MTQETCCIFKISKGNETGNDEFWRLSTVWNLFYFPIYMQKKTKKNLNHQFPLKMIDKLLLLLR